MTQNNTRNMALQGLNVIEMGQLIAGPFASKLLGEFGADAVSYTHLTLPTILLV